MKLGHLSRKKGSRSQSRSPSYFKMDLRSDHVPFNTLCMVIYSLQDLKMDDQPICCI